MASDKPITATELLQRKEDFFQALRIRARKDRRRVLRQALDGTYKDRLQYAINRTYNRYVVYPLIIYGRVINDPEFLASRIVSIFTRLERLTK